MASVDFEKSGREYCMLKDYWGLLKEYWIPEKSDEYWANLIANADKFAKKYGNEKFPRDLALSFINEQERRSKE